MNKGKIVFIMGNSCSGKGTLVENLKKENNSNFQFLQSYVTREPRTGEINGDKYWFISTSEFQKGVENEEFLEYKFVHNLNYYGTKKKDIEDGINSGKMIFKEIDIEGLKEILKSNPELKPFITSIFLTVSVEKFKERMIIRQGQMEKKEEENRILSLKKETEESKIYCDYIIETDDKTPEDILENVLEILKDIK